MSFFCTFSEIAGTFPARGLAINGSGPQRDADIGLREAICPQCGNKFSYTPGEHRYVRHKRHMDFKLCSYHCVRAWDKEKGDPLEKRIRDLEARIAFLKEQADLKPEERTDPRIKGQDISRLIERAESRLTTAYGKLAKKVIAG